MNRSSRPLKNGTGTGWIGVTPAKNSGCEVPVPIFQHPARTRGRGFTLVELLVVMTVSTMAIGVLVGIVSHVLRVNSSVGEHLEAVVALGQLSEQFRRDVHAAARAEIETTADQPRRLRLDGTGPARVEYEILASGLRRVETDALGGQHHELFVLPGMKILGWTEDFEAGGEVGLGLGWLIPQVEEGHDVRNRFFITASKRKFPVQETP
jgi:prepilin-type N-terminal cleavage/methylation domain-containing protein